jgi:hypothetical protein
MNLNPTTISEYKFDKDLNNNIEQNLNLDIKPNLNYWANSPVKVENSLSDSVNKSFQIISNDILLIKMENIIQKHPYKLNYKVNDSNLSLDKLCDFINENYIEESNSQYKFIYTTDLLKYYTKNSLVISFYSLQTETHKSKMIGLIIGRKSELHIQDKIFDTVEANFLTLNPKVRNKNLTSLIVSILTKELILNYSIGTAHYTINNPIKAPHYSLKYYYHRMINIPTLFKSEFISTDLSTDLSPIDQYIRMYNNFKNFLPNQKILYINKKNVPDTKTTPNDFIDLVCQNINSYSKFKYKIYEYIKREQLTELFESESFHHFIFLESNPDTGKLEIKNYICLNELKTFNSKTNEYYLNGYIYTGFYTNNIDVVIEKLSQYIYTNKILDIITWSDLFDVDNSCVLAVKGSGFLKYYLYNIQIYSISNQFNGLVTL